MLFDLQTASVKKDLVQSNKVFLSLLVSVKISWESVSGFRLIYALFPPHYVDCKVGVGIRLFFECLCAFCIGIKSIGGLFIRKP